MNAREWSSTQSQAMRSHIDAQISSGSWWPGYRLPTERVLSEEYEIARNTVRAIVSSEVGSTSDAEAAPEWGSTTDAV